MIGPAGGKASLGWGSEYWITDPSTYEGWESLRDLGKRLGRKWTKTDLALELADDLLYDVVLAAGGVEHSIGALRSAIAAAQEFVDKNLELHPAVRQAIADESATAAWYEFANVVSWARALDERLDRAPFRNKKLRRQGLVSALKPVRLKRRVERLVDDLRAGPMGETRHLANFTLHSALVRSSFSGAEVGADGRVRFPIPDRVAGSVANRKLFTWKERRDALAFTETLWESIQNFMDDLLAAFEKSIPKRLRK